MNDFEKEQNYISNGENNSTKEYLFEEIIEEFDKPVQEVQDIDIPAIIDEEEDILLRTGEYYHDNVNYPINVRFKHPFMNIISLICGVLSCICCVCATPAAVPNIALLKAFLIFILPAFLLSIIGTGLFIFDLAKSKTANGLSISGLILSIFGGIISIINLGIIIASFLIFEVVPLLIGFVTSAGSVIIGFITFIVTTVLAFIF